MSKRLELSLLGLVIHQFKGFILWYLGAMFCLWATHWIGGQLPFLAKELAEMTGATRPDVETWKFFALAAGIIVFRSLSRLLFFYPARILEKDLRVEILQKLESVSPTRYTSYSSGQLFQILSQDMDQIRALIGFALLQVGNIFFALVVLLPKLFEFNPKLIIALSPMLLAFLLFTIIVSGNRKFYRKVQDQQGEVQNLLIETYAGKKTIKNFHAEKAFSGLFKEYSMRELLNFYKAGVRISYSMPLLTLGTGISLVWGGHFIFQEQLGASAIVLFSGFIFLFVEPLAYVSWIGVVAARSHGSWSRIRELISKIKDDSEIEKMLKSKESHQSSFSYDVMFWQKQTNINILKNKWNVLIGKTGDGKTHILRQIADSLKIQGKRISYVAQAPYLYHETILDNIFLGKTITDKDRDNVFELLELFDLTYLEKDKATLLSMEVGENGKNISGGQAKRLCMIRSIMAKAEYLIWDDPFSSVDVILEKEILEKLKSLPQIKNTTIIMTSHRLSSVRGTDKIIFIEKEKGIIEQGKTIDLLLKDTKTYEYFTNQMV